MPGWQVIRCRFFFIGNFYIISQNQKFVNKFFQRFAKYF